MAGKVANAVGAGLGWGIGMGLTLGATGALTGGLRPLAKSAIRAGIAVRERVTATGTEAWEQAQDLYHEALEERRRGGAAAVLGASDDGSRRTATLSIPGGAERT